VTTPHAPSWIAAPWADPALDWSAQRVIVTGGAGFLGSAVVRALRARGVPDANVAIIRRKDFDLTTREGARRAINASFGSQGPTLILHCAAAVGGIQANRDQPGRFFFDNIAMAINLVEEFRLAGLIEKHAAIVQVGSMTSYPAAAPIPFKEDDLWRGYPDAVSAPYGIAKLAAWQMLDAAHRQHGLRAGYVVPVNLYGPGDNIADEKNAHVAGSLVRRIVEATRTNAPQVVNWGTGSPTREFLYIDDAAESLLRAAERALAIDPNPTPINLGSGREISIKSLAELIARLAGYKGTIGWDATKPDGQPRRCLDTTRAKALLGWSAQTKLEDGLSATIDWYTKLKP
jgi:GDP-L-fucose synthase